MKTFKEYLAINEASKGILPAVIKTDSFGSSSSDKTATVAKVQVSGDKLTLEFVDKRKLSLSNISEVISASGLKTGSLVHLNFNYKGVKYSGNGFVKHTKSQGSIDVMDESETLLFFIEYKGNKNFMDGLQGTWNSFTGGVKGEPTYHLGKFTGSSTQTYPTKGTSITYKTAQGQTVDGVVLDMNGVAKTLKVKSSDGKTDVVNMVWDN